MGMCLHFQWFTINSKSSTPFTVFCFSFFFFHRYSCVLYMQEFVCLFVLCCCVCWLYGLIGLNCNSNRHCKFQLFTFPIHLLYENIFVGFFFWVHQTERTTARVRARENKGEFWPTWLDWFQWCLSSTLCGIIIGFVLYEAKVVLHLVRSSVSVFFTSFLFQCLLLFIWGVG